MTQDPKSPTSWTGDLYFVMSLKSYSFGNVSCWPFNSARNDPDEILLHMIEGVTFNLPDTGINVRQEAINSLEAEKQKINAETHVKLEAVQTKIDALKQITHEAAE